MGNGYILTSVQWQTYLKNSPDYTGGPIKINYMELIHSWRILKYRRKKVLYKVMRLKNVGFFKELKHGIENGESLKDNISINPQFNENKIVKYLEGGIIYCISPGIVFDVIDKSNGIIGSLRTMTDGEWIWPSDLAYYVKQYHVKLNEDFIISMKNKNWIIPNKENIKLEQLEL